MERKVGKYISIGQETVKDKTGEAELNNGKPIVQMIIGDYNNGWVKAESGDIWKVQPVSNSNYQYIAVR